MEKEGEEKMELTILFPCLNEEASIEFCIREAKEFLTEYGIDGEVLVADNGSTDRSRELALQSGARVADAEKKGYGEALRCGLGMAQGEYVIMADADGSYDVRNLMPYLSALRKGSDMVIGDRYRGGFLAGASPWTHRVVGIPLLSFFGRLAQRRYHTPAAGLVHDFHCGLRGMRREHFPGLELKSGGMEFASEMILAASRRGLKITQVSAILRPDHRGGKPSHLRSIPDAIRHIRVIAGYLRLR